MDSSSRDKLMLNRWAWPVVLAALVGACRDDAGRLATVDTKAETAAADWLVEIGADAGLDFVHDSKLDGSFFMPQIMGSGGALFDYDSDGDLDVYLVRSGPNAMYRQEADGRFLELGAESGLDQGGYGMGATVGDYDNDGDLDLLVTNYGPNALYRNNGDGTFSDSSEAAGIRDDAWSTSAAFFDYDNDGHLDLYVANYLEYDPAKTCRDQSGRAEYCGPQAYPGRSDSLYRNNGDGTFADVTRGTGVHSTAGKGLGVVTADFDGDGWQDVFVANDGAANQLWINSSQGSFEDRAFAHGVAVNGFGKPEASMGIALGDADGDLNLDLYLTHLDRETNTLYTAAGPGAYQDTTAISGLGPDSLPWTGFGTGFFDLENDGDLDLISVNGRVRRPPGVAAAPEDPLTAYAEPNALALNSGNGRYVDGCPLATAFCAPREVSRGLILGDIDSDGDLDVLITNSNGPARLYRNDTPGAGHWLAVRALDGRHRRDAIGSRVYVNAGDTWMVRPVTHSYGYLVGADATAHFGLGAADRVERIVVRWADGAHEAFPSVAAGQKLTVARGQGLPADPPSPSP